MDGWQLRILLVVEMRGIEILDMESLESDGYLPCCCVLMRLSFGVGEALARSSRSQIGVEQVVLILHEQ